MSNNTEITILGGGIMGLMVAYTLADNHNITLYDPKGFPADNASPNASSVAGGMLAPYSEIEHMNMQWVNAGRASTKMWQGINLDTGFTQNGSLLVAHPDDKYILNRFVAHLPKELQTYQNVQSLEPQVSSKLTQGVHLSEEAHLDPRKTMASLCNYLRQHKNVTLKAKKLQTKNYKLKTIIDCRGISANAPNLRGVKGEILIVENKDFTLSRPVRLMHPRYPLYIVPRDNHKFLIGATIIESGEDESVSLRSSMELMSALYTLSPSFADAKIIELKAGIRPSYPDNLPRITIKNNIISCNGMYRHGYLLAPIMAQCVKDHLNGETNEHMHLFTKDQGNESHHQRAA